MKDFNSYKWEVLAEAPSDWQSSISKGAKVHKAKQIHDAKTKRETRKSRANSATTEPGLFSCPLCNRTRYVIKKLVNKSVTFLFKNC